MGPRIVCLLVRYAYLQDAYSEVLLYNFGKQNGEDLFEDEAIDVQGSGKGEIEEVAGTGNIWMNQKRDSIAALMWKDYQAYI